MNSEQKIWDQNRDCQECMRHHPNPPSTLTLEGKGLKLDRTSHSASTSLAFIDTLLQLDLRGKLPHDNLISRCFWSIPDFLTC